MKRAAKPVHVARMRHLQANGPTAHAFTFRQPFEPDAAGELAPATADDRDACPA